VKREKFKRIGQMRKEAVDIWSSALEAVHPGAALRKACSLNRHILALGKTRYDIRQFDRVLVVGAGKASGSMAFALEDILGDVISGGAVSVKYGHGETLERIRLIEAGHPLPDKNSETAALDILHIAYSADKNDLVIGLMSGGGSALLCLPVEGIPFEDKQKTIHALLSCGAAIHEINTIRKHISAVKGGRLAEAAHPATVISLLLSDVVGDDLDVIASGPTAPDDSIFLQCLEIVRKYRLDSKVPESVLRYLENGVGGISPETPKKGDPCFLKTTHVLIGSNFQAVLAAKKRAEELGYRCLILSTMVQGEAAQVAKIHAAVAKEILKSGNPASVPACILSGGETTVTVTGEGTGGRNMEFALSFAQNIEGGADTVLLSAGTDGTDGPTDAAGAIVDGNTCFKARAMGLSPEQYLASNDSYAFFKATGDLFITGPTKTNVMDIQIMLVDRP
jgi:glycerate 2-kinase